MTQPLLVLVCSYLEPPLVERIGALDGVEVLDAPGLLPVPRYPCDHNGAVRQLSAAQRAEWAALLARAEVCFDFDWEQPAAIPERAPNCRFIQATSAGIGGFMQRTGLDHSAIAVATAAGVHAVPLAEWVVAALLHVVKDVDDLKARQRAHRWERIAVGALSGRRALVVGLGHVGRHVATVLSGLGVEVWGAGRPGGRYDVPVLARLGRTDALGELLPHCDDLVLTAPLTPATERLIGETELAMLHEGSIVVNIGRGQLVDEEALIRALSTRAIRAAALDVVRSEPLAPDSPLWDLDNVLICPHSASTFTTENATLVELFLDNLERYRRGEPLRNAYDPVRGY